MTRSIARRPGDWTTTTGGRSARSTTEPQPSASGENAADEKTAAGAKATLVEFADAYAEADGERLCAMVSAELLKAAEKAPGGCEGGVARIKDILEPKDVVEIKESAAKQTPTVEGDVASLPGRGEVMRYREGRWELTGEGIANP